jgi:signal transduction histidine kinase
MFGHRPDPLDAAANVVGALSDDPVLALGTIREALVLPYAALSANGVLVAASGTAVTHTRNWELSLGGERVAELVVGLRAGDLALSPGDEHVLRLVAPLLAQALRARRLAADLQASREETITALEEERRRLRRDLHDGLGPRLSGIAFTSDAARNTLRQDPDAADTLLAAIRAETVTAISEIRQLVYGMRPPALDELGLVPAVRQQAAALHTRDNRSFGVRIEASNLPPLPAAVEVAAYRIVVEALTNAARHSAASTATACLSVVGAALVVEVRDGGFGAGPWSPGVGITSMRERAAELGGTLTVDHSAGGTVVRAGLPLQR